MNFSKYLKARIHCEIYLSDCKKHNLMHISLHLIWFHLFKIRIIYVKRKPPRTIIRKKCHIPMFATSPCCGHWLICFSWKVYFLRRLFFFTDHFTRDKNGFVHYRIHNFIDNLLELIISELLYFAGYSNIRQNISKNQATYR